MTTNLELIKGTSREVFYMTDVDSKLISYITLSDENKVIFDAYVNALKTEFDDKSLSLLVNNSEVAYNQNLDILLVVEDSDLVSTFVTDPIDYSALSADVQTKMTEFINMANSL